MQEVMGDKDICILRGHGLIVVGPSVEQATLTAIKLDTLAKMNLQAASLGKVPSIPDEDIAAVPEPFRQGQQLGGRDCGSIIPNGWSKAEAAGLLTT